MWYCVVFACKIAYCLRYLMVSQEKGNIKKLSTSKERCEPNHFQRKEILSLHLCQLGLLLFHGLTVVVYDQTVTARFTFSNC